MNASNRLAQQLGDRERPDPAGFVALAVKRNRVGHDQLFERRLSLRSNAGPDSTPCTAQQTRRAAPLSFSALGPAFTMVPGRVDDVILETDGTTGDITDTFSPLWCRPSLAALVDHRQFSVQRLAYALARSARRHGRATHRQMPEGSDAPGNR